MKAKIDRINSVSTPLHSRGMTLLDVLLAIVIFAVGMLALSSLQGNLTRSSADANARTAAVNIAEELIEDMRTFEQTRSETGVVAYQDIVSTTDTETRANIDYNIVVTVQDWYFLADGVTPTNNTGDLPSNRDTTISDFKYVDISVSWDGSEFQRGDGVETTGRLGAGTFNVGSIIPSVAQLGAAKVAAEDDGAPGTPPVAYVPGNRPDIMRISLDNSRYKESTTPEPIVVRKNELMETWFDVITYNTAYNPNVFERREEFVSISCECTLKRDGGTNDDGREPTLWTGLEYVEGDFVGKPYGVSASNQQSQYCDTCCRDHHDSSGSGAKYRPWMANNEYINNGNFAGDHPHYNRDNQGDLVLADKDGDTYLEACRLVRKDGFFRVAQDFNLYENNAFDDNFLVGDSSANAYSSYIRAVADSELGSGSAPGDAASTLQFTGWEYDTPLDIAGGSYASPTRQLMSRGIYVDAMNSKLSDNIADCFGNGNRNDCGLADPSLHTVYEFYPFFDIQVTHLARWGEIDANDPVDITNEEIANNGYDRGLGQQAGSGVGRSTGQSTLETGNIGLISTLPITEVPAAVFDSADLYLRAGEGEDPPTTSDNPIIEGTLSAAGGTSDAAILILTGSTDVLCDKPLNNEEFVCEILPTAIAPYTVTVSNYNSTKFTLSICSNLVTLGSEWTGTEAGNWTRFQLPPSSTTGVTFHISKSGCP